MVKGGHFAGGGAPDVVVADGKVTLLEGPRVVTSNDHGTGCSLSAATAARMAAGVEVMPALEQAKAYVAGALRGAATWSLGAGHGPLDHFGWDAPSM